MLLIAYDELKASAEADGSPLPTNSKDLLRRNLDCAVIRRVHSILEDGDSASVDSVKGVFTEGEPAYPGSGFLKKTHIQIAICNLDCIPGVFQLDPKQYKG